MLCFKGFGCCAGRSGQFRSLVWGLWSSFFCDLLLVYGWGAYCAYLLSLAAGGDYPDWEVWGRTLWSWCGISDLTWEVWLWICLQSSGLLASISRYISVLHVNVLILRILEMRTVRTIIQSARFKYIGMIMLAYGDKALQNHFIRVLLVLSIHWRCLGATPHIL